MRTIIFVVEKLSNSDLIFQTSDGCFFRTITFFLISCLKTYHDKFSHALLFRIIHVHQNYCLRRMQHSNAVRMQLVVIYWYICARKHGLVSQNWNPVISYLKMVFHGRFVLLSMLIYEYIRLILEYISLRFERKQYGIWDMFNFQYRAKWFIVHMRIIITLYQQTARVIIF